MSRRKFEPKPELGGGEDDDAGVAVVAVPGPAGAWTEPESNWSLVWARLGEYVTELVGIDVPGPKNSL